MMNYEASPFQNYESITIDELKDQANSLLNLVTEEQRPLRVCMNNGKEFLLFPQDLLAPICDSDFRLILLSAMRYAMGRNTCPSHTALPTAGSNESQSRRPGRAGSEGTAETPCRYSYIRAAAAVLPLPDSVDC